LTRKKARINTRVYWAYTQCLKLVKNYLTFGIRTFVVTDRITVDTIYVLL